MVFHEIRLGTKYTYGSKAGRTFNNKILESDSGDESSVQYWINGRRKILIDKENLTKAEADAAEIFHTGRRGNAYAFRARDWTSYLLVDEALPLLTNTTAQIQKVYADAVNPETWLIKKPVLAANVNATIGSLDYSPDITLKRDGSAFASSGNWTLDRNTGIITFSTSQAGHTFTVSGSYDIPVRFSSPEALIEREAQNIFHWRGIELLEVKV